MIIACPACKTRYVVPDAAIGIEGRTVRCAKCKHSWFQNGPELDAPPAEASQTVESAPPPPPPPPPAEEEAPSEEPEAGEEHAATAAVDEPPAGSEARPSVNHWQRPQDNVAAAASTIQPARRREAADEAVVEVAAPPEYDAPRIDRVREEPTVEDDGTSQFDYEPPFRPRRNPLKLWTAAAVGFFIVAIALIGAVGYWGLPGWFPVSQPTFAANQPNLELVFPPEQQDRRTLPNGTEYFGASGTVTNVGRETVSLPPILIVMRDERDKIVYDWEIAPSQPTLAPGETLTIKEAVTDVPRSAKFAEIGWGHK